jgi:F0F1-type ATP synthase alpha subunit
VTRIGSNAQCKWMKLISAGVKNELTTRRNNSSNNNSRSLEYDQLICLNHIFFQDHLLICSIETSLILLLVYRNGILFNNLFQIHSLLLILSIDYLYLYYILFISKTAYSLYLYSFIWYFFSYIIIVI